MHRVDRVDLGQPYQTQLYYIQKVQHPNKRKTNAHLIATSRRVFACITLMILIQLADASAAAAVAFGRRIIFQSGALYEAVDLR
jgi:hypothetical protein